jgi:hypothetical protein
VLHVLFAMLSGLVPERRQRSRQLRVPRRHSDRASASGASGTTREDSALPCWPCSSAPLSRSRARTSWTVC